MTKLMILRVLCNRLAVLPKIQKVIAFLAFICLLRQEQQQLHVNKVSECVNENNEIIHNQTWQEKERKHGEVASKALKRFRSSQVEAISEISAESGNESSEKETSKKMKKKAVCQQKKMGKQGKQGTEVDLEDSISISSAEDDDDDEEDSADLSSLDEESEPVSEDEPEQITSKRLILKEKKTFQQENITPNQPKQQKLTVVQKGPFIASVDNIVENKSLTINEMEAMSKLLSIQADGLKRKQQQQQSKNSLKQVQKQAPSLKAFLGQLPVKKVKSEVEPDAEVHNKQQIVKKNITALINLLPSDEDVYEDLNMKSRQFTSRQKKQEQEMQQQPMQMYQGAFPQYQQYPVRQNITPNGKTGKLTPNIVPQGYLGQGVGKISTCTMKNIPGKLTPMIRGNMQNQFTHQREQLNNLVEIESQIQSRIETIKNEIGPLLSCLNSDVLGGGASLHQNQLLQEKQQFLNTNSNNCLQADPYLNSRIFQDLSERRAQLQLQDQEYQAYQLQLQQQQQMQQQMQAKMEQERQLKLQQQQQQQEYEYIQMMNFQNQQERIKVSAQNFRQNEQEQMMNMKNFNNLKRGWKQNGDDVHEHQQIGRNYDARAGDWLCGNCKNFNFAYREICNRCGLKQDDNILMVHPQITEEALDLIHELNHTLKKQPSTNTNETKRIYRKVGQNKENNSYIFSGNSKENNIINHHNNFNKQTLMYQDNQQQVPKRQSLFQQQQQKYQQKQNFLF